MNFRRISLFLLVVNLAMLGVIVALVSLRPRQGLAPANTNRPVLVENTVTQVLVRKFNTTNLLAELSKLSLGWSSIESTNYLIYMRNLRTFGCPDETIRDIILTDIAKLYARRQAEVLNVARPFEYWRTTAEGETDALDAAIQQELTTLQNERDRLVMDLLHVDFYEEMGHYLDSVEASDRMLVFLEPQKRRVVASLQHAYEKMKQAIWDQSGGVLLPVDEARLRNLEAQKMNELATILTPEELASYELHLSPLAQDLRRELHGFEPSPEEFQSIYRLRKSYDQIVDSALSENNQLDSDLRKEALEKAKTALDQELQKVLGADRYTSYERAQDPDYQFLVSWTDRLQLPQDMAQQVYNMKQEANRQKERVESNLQLTYEQRQQAYQAIAQETEKSLSRVLGTENYQAYRGSGGQWIDQLRQTDEALELLVPEIQNILEEPDL